MGRKRLVPIVDSGTCPECGAEGVPLFSHGDAVLCRACRTRAKNRDRQRVANMTPDQIERRRVKNMTPAQRHRKRERDRERQRKHYAAMTPAQRERERQRQRTENMAPAQIERRRERQRRAKMTPEQRHRKRQRQRTENMAPAQIERRRERQRTQMRVENMSPQQRLADRLRNRLRSALRGKTKNGSAVRDLGCTLDELRRWLSAHMKPGMPPDLGDIHIDHVRPLAGFNLEDRAQFRAASHHSNLQPLWAEENLSKHAGDAPRTRVQVDMSHHVQGLDYHGCTPEELVRWLQAHIRARGWSWDGFGTVWTIAGSGHFSDLRPVAI